MNRHDVDSSIDHHSAATPLSAGEWMETDYARRFNVVRAALLKCNAVIWDEFKEASDALASLEGEMKALVDRG